MIVFLDDSGDQKYVSPDNRFTITVNQPDATKTLALSIPAGMVQENNVTGAKNAEVTVEENIATVYITTEPEVDGKIRLSVNGTYVSWGDAKISGGSAVLHDVPFGDYKAHIILDVNGKAVVLPDNVFDLHVGAKTVRKTFHVTVPQSKEVKEGSATLRVFDYDSNAPISGAKILATKDNTTDVIGETNSGGYAQIFVGQSGLTVFVQKEGYFPSREIRITPNNLYNVPLKQAPKEGNVSVTVKNPIGQPIKGATVVLTDSDGKPIKGGYTKGDGKILFTHVPEGDYTVKATYGSESGTTTVHVSSNR